MQNFTVRNGRVLDKNTTKLQDELARERMAFMATRWTMGVRAERYLRYHYFTKR